MPARRAANKAQRLATYGRSRAVRHPYCDYAGAVDVHVTISAFRGKPFQNAALAAMVCQDVELYACKLRFRLYGYCVMPDHLHVLLSPADSGVPLARWLREFKSHTTREYQKFGQGSELWQRSAHDHVCREGETAENVLAYIVDNPVRAGLVGCWRDWTWTKVLIAL